VCEIDLCVLLQISCTLFDMTWGMTWWSFAVVAAWHVITGFGGTPRGLNDTYVGHTPRDPVVNDDDGSFAGDDIAANIPDEDVDDHEDDEDEATAPDSATIGADVDFDDSGVETMFSGDEQHSALLPDDASIVEILAELRDPDGIIFCRGCHCRVRHWDKWILCERCHWPVHRWCGRACERCEEEVPEDPWWICASCRYWHVIEIHDVPDDVGASSSAEEVYRLQLHQWSSAVPDNSSEDGEQQPQQSEPGELVEEPEVVEQPQQSEPGALDDSADGEQFEVPSHCHSL
jgi:hypothetical protein